MRELGFLSALRQDLRFAALAAFRRDLATVLQGNLAITSGRLAAILQPGRVGCWSPGRQHSRSCFW